MLKRIFESDLFKKLRIVLDKGEKKLFLKVLVLDIVMGFFQSISIVSVFAFINIVMDPSSLFSNDILSYLYDLLNCTDVNIFLMIVGGSVLVLLLLGNSLSAYSVWLKTYFVWNVNVRVTEKLLHKYLFSPYAYFLGRNTSELEKNILSESNALSGSFLLSLLNIIEGFSTILIILIMLILTNPLVTIVTIGILSLIYVLIYLRFSRIIKATGVEKIEEDKGRYKAVGEALQGIKYTKVSGREEYFLSEYLKHAERFSELQAKNNIIGKLPRFLMEVIAFGGIIGIILFFLGTNRDIGEIIPLIALFGSAGYRLLPALQSVYDSYAIFRFNKPVLDKIADELDQDLLQAESIKRKNQERLEFKEELKLKDINFSYNGTNKAVLKNVSLAIKKNTSVAFVGSTGSGKTTLVDIVLGLLIPDNGSILVDNKEITNENIKEWQRNLGYVPQDIYLCDDTIAKNIGFGIPLEDIDMEQIKRVAKMANISDFVEKELPEKYSTVVGERGVRLSGGQRQRIGIARALYSNPDILIFDEATSSLDNITERAVLEAIENISQTKTIIMIAHRLSTVENCDEIFLLEKGEVIGSGNYESLLRDNEEFKEMSKISENRNN
jgi:ATP-binding cassette subfamily C protein